MKFTVEVEDFYLEEEDLSSALKHTVKQEVISEINKSVKKQVEDFMNTLMKNEIDAELKTRVKLHVTDFLESGQVKGRYTNDKEVSIKDWIADTIKVEHKNINDYIVKAVKEQTAELRNRYDLMFASQIITKINDQGFLKEEVAKLLLAGSN